MPWTVCSCAAVYAKPTVWHIRNTLWNPAYATIWH